MSKNFRSKTSRLLAGALLAQTVLGVPLYATENVDTVASVDAEAVAVLINESTGLSVLEDGRYKSTIDVWQEFRDEDSMCRNFIPDQIVVNMVDGVAELSLYILRSPSMNGYIFEDTIGVAEYLDADGNWVELDKTLVMAEVGGEMQECWQLKVITDTPTVQVRAVIAAMGYTNPAFRVIIRDAVEYIGAVDILDLEDGLYQASTDIFKEFADEDSMCKSFLPSNLEFEIIDGELKSTLYILKSPSVGSYRFEDTIGDVEYMNADGEWVLVEKTLHLQVVDGVEQEVWKFDVKVNDTEIYLRAVVEAMGGTNPAFRMLLRDAQLVEAY